MEDKFLAWCRRHRWLTEPCREIVILVFMALIFVWDCGKMTIEWVNKIKIGIVECLIFDKKMIILGIKGIVKTTSLVGALFMILLVSIFVWPLCILMLPVYIYMTMFEGMIKHAVLKRLKEEQPARERGFCLACMRRWPKNRKVGERLIPDEPYDPY